MYAVYADDLCIFNDEYLDENHQLINPKLTLQDNSAGSFTFTIPPVNVGYSTVNRLSSTIRVEKNGEEIWEGRVISEDQDFWNNRRVTCEGELAYLNDTHQTMFEYHDVSPRSLLLSFLTNHNAKVTDDRKFVLGNVTVTDPNDSLYRYTNYETTYDCIKDKLVDRLGGHLVIRKVSGRRILDYLADYNPVTTQSIEFGKNLIEFTKNWDLSNLSTVIIPFGEALEESPIEQLTAYLDVSSVNDGSIYVKSDSAIAEYGWISEVVHWDDVTVASNLLSKAQEYLQESQFQKMQIEISAFDLSLINPDIREFKLLDQVWVKSSPHGLNTTFPISKIVIPLDKPEETRYTLAKELRDNSMTGANNRSNSDLLDKIENIPTQQITLQKAFETAAALLNNATNGYVTIVTNENGAQELIVSETPDYRASNKLWRWNMNGLGYSNDGGRSYEVAITMDGQIAGKFIAANSILTASLSQEFKNTYKTYADTQTAFQNADDAVRTAFANADSSLSSTLTQAFTAADGVVKSEISQTYETKTAAATQYSSLQQSVNGLSSTVSTKVGASEVISKINQSSESVVISADKIQLSGNDVNIKANVSGIKKLSIANSDNTTTDMGLNDNESWNALNYTDAGNYKINRTTATMQFNKVFKITSANAFRFGQKVEFDSGIDCYSDVNVAGKVGANQGYFVKSQATDAYAYKGHYQGIDTRLVNDHFIEGGYTIIQKSGTGTSALILSNDTLNAIAAQYGFTHSGDWNSNTAVHFSNGDGGANDAHIDGATYISGSGWYAVFDRNVSDGALLRVNYIIMFFGYSIL